MPPTSTSRPRIYTLHCWQMLRSNRAIGIWWGARRTSGSPSVNIVLALVMRRSRLAAHRLSIGYIPSDVWEPTGTNTKQVSRTIEVCEPCVGVLVRGNGAHVAYSIPSTTSPSPKWRAPWETRRTLTKCETFSNIHREASNVLTHHILQYAGRAGNFANVWNPNVTVPGRDDIVGMMQVRVL